MEIQMNQIIEYTEQDFLENPSPYLMIELAMETGYDSIFDYKFTVGCYREMLKYMDEKIKDLEYEVMCCNEELIENTEQEIIDEMAE